MNHYIWHFWVSAVHLCVPLLLFLSPALLPAQGMIEGNAVLTSHSGTISVRGDSGQNRPVEPRTGFSPTGTQWSTPNNAQAFLAFSNGTALGIGKSTRLDIVNYQQEPFSPEKEGFSYEPSTSKLTLELESGQLALVCQRLSPVSELRIRLPHGSLRIHRGIVHIRYDQTGLHIAMVEGNSTYYYPDNDAREFVTGGSIVRIGVQSVQRQQIAERLPVDTLTPDAVQLYQATTHASRRVLFRANAGTNAPPAPRMVVRPDYYQQPSPRPYEFKD